MSRIHEALKKAVEERSTHVEPRTTEELMDSLHSGPADGGTVLMPNARQTAVQLVTPSEIEDDSLTYPSLLAKARKMIWNIKPRYSVFSAGASTSSGAERFRTLRSRLYQISAIQPIHRVLLTSSLPEEGKTFVATNLAQSIVRQAGRKVMLIDADLRASRLHLTLGTDNEPGLSDYLNGDKELSQIVQVGDIDGFCFIPGGRFVSNPSEILHSAKMKTLLERMGEIFDWVILDSPPATAVHDASILADMCDGVLFVLRAGVTDYEIAQKCAGEFESKNLLGVVLNRVDKFDAYGAYYYYGNAVPQTAQ